MWSGFRPRRGFLRHVAAERGHAFRGPARSRRQLEQLAAARPHQTRLGRAPYLVRRGAGAGRRTLAEYCASRGLDLQTVSARLQSKGIKFAPDRSLRDIALDNGFDRPYGIIDIIEEKD